MILTLKLRVHMKLARSVVLDEARKCIKNNLFELQTNDKSDNELLQGCMVILSCVQEDERIKNAAINQINTTLDQLYKVTKYVHTYVLMYCFIPSYVFSAIVMYIHTYMNLYCTYIRIYHWKNIDIS